MWLLRREAIVLRSAQANGWGLTLIVDAGDEDRGWGEGGTSFLARDRKQNQFLAPESKHQFPGPESKKNRFFGPESKKSSIFFRPRIEKIY